MKIKTTLLFFLFACFQVFSQENSFKPCYSEYTQKWNPHYYSFHVKYPISSETLVEQVNEATKSVPQQNGYITVRFLVNCKGEIGNFELIEIDENYNKTQFNEAYVEEILHFVKTLTHWPIPFQEIKDKPKLPLEYHYYFSFKIEHEKVVEIIP